MNNKKVLTLASIALLGTGGVVTALLFKDTVTNHLIEASEETYTLKVANQAVGSDGSLSVETQDGNTITFKATNLTYVDGNYTLAAGGVLSNPYTEGGYGNNRISQITSVSVDSSAALTLDYGWTTDVSSGVFYGSEVISSENPVYFDANYAPSYLNLSNSGTDAVTFTELVITYRCGEEGERLKGTNVLPPIPENIPLNKGAQDLAANEISCWTGFDSGGAITNAVTTEDSISLTYTNSTNWWGNQIFAKTAYHGAETTYKVSMVITADVSGEITVNGEVVTLVENEPYYYVDTVTNNVDATNQIQLSVQLGSWHAERPESERNELLPNGTITFDYMKIMDLNSTFHDVHFKDSTGNDLGTVLGREGSALYTTPDAPVVEGFAFAGWSTDGTLDGVVNLTTWSPNADTTLTSVYSQDTYTVSYHVNGNVIRTESVAPGVTTNAPSLGYDECGFGYSVAAWYTNDGLTEAFDFNTAVNSDLDLYAKLQVTPTQKHNLDDAWFTNNDDGSLHFTTTGRASTNTYDWQLNFAPLPVGDSLYNYTVIVEYRSSHEFPVTIANNNDPWNTFTRGTLSVSPNETKTISLSYAGGSIAASTKLSFELCNIGVGETLDLTIHSISVTHTSATA